MSKRAAFLEEGVKRESGAFRLEHLQRMEATAATASTAIAATIGSHKAAITFKHLSYIIQRPQ